MNIREVMVNPELFGGQFGGDTWTAWRALLCGFYGLALDDDELAHWQALTRRDQSPQQALEELWQVVGRRGGKSQCAALLAVFSAVFFNHAERLAPGEIATVLCLAADRKQARAVFRYITGLLHSNPMLEKLIVREDRETIELANRTVIEVGTASFRTTRGYTLAAVICDEIAFWRSEDSANPDFEIINALRPGLATLGGKLIALSSPYSKRGELWEHHRRYFGKDGSILVAQAPSQVMNPSLDGRVIEQAYERDPEVAKAEYGAEFRSDLEAFISRDMLEPLLRHAPLELPFDSRHRYSAFTDPSGGGQDEFCLSIGHKESETIVVDLVRGLKGTPANIVAEYATLLKSYGIHRVTGDRYAGSWPADEFQKHGIRYEHAVKPKSGLYVDVLPAINSERVEIPADDRLITQLCNLERRTSRAGRDSVDHPPGGHDDRANAVAGVVAGAVGVTFMWGPALEVDRRRVEQVIQAKAPPTENENTQWETI